MKISGPHTAQASSLTLPANPTSPTTTVLQYTIIILLTVNHLLDDHPRHIRFREILSHARESPPNTARPQRPRSEDHTPPPPSRTPPIPRKSTFHATEKLYESYTQPTSPYVPSSQLPIHPQFQHPPHENYVGQHKKRPVSNGKGCKRLSKAQMNEAWIRMRAVSRLRVKLVDPNTPHPSISTDKQGGKKVRWGPVQVYEYEHEHGYEQNYDSGVKEAEVEENVAKPESGRNADVNELKHEYEGKVEKQHDRELWGAADTKGGYELWGPTPGSDGQMG